MAVAACGVIATVTGVMMFAGRSDKDIKAKASADQQMADEEATVSYRVPWDEYAMNAKYETFEYNDVEYVSMGHVDKSLFLDSKLTTMTLETENYETNKKGNNKSGYLFNKATCHQAFIWRWSLMTALWRGMMIGNTHLITKSI